MHNGKLLCDVSIVGLLDLLHDSLGAEAPLHAQRCVKSGIATFLFAPCGPPLSACGPFPLEAANAYAQQKTHDTLDMKLRLAFFYNK